MDGRPLRLYGERRELAQLLPVLRAGLISGGDAAAALEFLRRALGVTGITISHDWSYGSWHHVAGDLGDWPRIYEPIRETDPSREPLLVVPFGTFYIAHAHSQLPIFGLLQEVGFGDALLFRVPSIRRGHVLIAAFRERGSRLFGEDDLASLGVLYPHLSLALRTLTTLQALDRPPGESRERFLASGVPHAFVTLPGGQVEWSSAGRGWWLDRQGPLPRHRWQALERALVRASTLASRTHRLPAGTLVDFVPVPCDEPGRVCRLALFTDAPGPTPIESPPVSAAEECLTERERQVARLYAAGRSASELADRLDMRPHTARVHLRNIYEKLGVNNRAELIRLLTPA